MSILLGYLFLFLNVLVVIAMTTDKYKIYLDFHSVICVLGGTALTAVVAFGGKSLMQLFQIYRAAVKKKANRTDLLVVEVVKIAKETKGEISQSFLASYKSEFLFLRDGLALIADGFSKEQIEAIMEERIDKAEDRYKQDEKMIQALTKVPPSFGLVGTTVGLIALFAEVGGADSLKKIGPAMAVALTATLYGVLLAFVVLNPMLERVKMVSHHDITERQVVLKAVLLLKSKASPMYIEELLKSHLTFGKQNKLPSSQSKAA
jgi:chemotaxis protein MotA